MASKKLVLRVVITNPKAIKALRYALTTLEELEEDLAYRPEVKKAARALRYAASNLRFKGHPQ